MKKISILSFFIILFAFPSMLYAACTGTSPNLYAASASQSDVMDCVNVATYGDTINIPAGSSTWSSSTAQGCINNSLICMTKNIRLIGAGSGSTIITLGAAPVNGAIQYVPDSTARTNDGVFELSGFSIDYGIFNASSGGMLQIYNFGTTAISQIKIHDNIFKSSTKQVTGTWENYSGNVWSITIPDALSAYYAVSFDGVSSGEPNGSLGLVDSEYDWFPDGTTLYVYSVGDPAATYSNIRYGNRSCLAIATGGPVYGVVYRNSFVDVGTGIKVEGANAKSWDLNQREYGTDKSMFFEDNTFTFSAGTPVEDVGATAGQGGSLVFRYNTLNLLNNTRGDELFDLHGLQSMSSSNATCNGGCSGTSCYTQTTEGIHCCNEWSQVKSEIYGNKWLNLNKADGYSYWVIMRGSWMLMFGNNAAGTYSGGSAPSPKYREYACDDCLSAWDTTPYSMHIQNTYAWSNIYNSVNKSITSIGDYCSTGVGTYTITENTDYYNYSASFNGASGIGCGPLANLPATCTTGVGYWATNQKCDDLTGMVGANPATPISGTLYKCTATNTWTPYYTPYTYPHPLRGGNRLFGGVVAGGTF